MITYRPVNDIKLDNLGDQRFLQFLNEIEAEFSKMYPNTALSLDEVALRNSFNEGMTAHMTLSELHYNQ